MPGSTAVVLLIKFFPKSCLVFGHSYQFCMFFTKWLFTTTLTDKLCVVFSCYKYREIFVFSYSHLLNFYHKIRPCPFVYAYFTKEFSQNRLIENGLRLGKNRVLELLQKNYQKLTLQMALNKRKNDLVLFHTYLTYVKLPVLKFSDIANVSWKNRVIELNFYFHTSLWCLKRFFHKTFWSTTKKCENKNLI